MVFWVSFPLGRGWRTIPCLLVSAYPFLLSVTLRCNIRDACKNNGIQYILTVIDSDLPRDQSDQKLLFTDQEIIRYLNDSGDDGRLFKTRAF